MAYEGLVRDERELDIDACSSEIIIVDVVVFILIISICGRSEKMRTSGVVTFILINTIMRIMLCRIKSKYQGNQVSFLPP